MRFLGRTNFDDELQAALGSSEFQAGSRNVPISSVPRRLVEGSDFLSEHTGSKFKFF